MLALLEMNNPALIANWMRNFREAGIEGLSKEKGRPLTLTQEKENKKKNTTTEERDRIKALESKSDPFPKLRMPF